MRLRLAAPNERVFAALFDWRDASAREEDESVAFVLPNHSLVTLARVAPTTVAQLFRALHPVPTVVRARAQKVIATVRAALSASAGTLTSPEQQRAMTHVRFDDGGAPIDEAATGVVEGGSALVGGAERVAGSTAAGAADAAPSPPPRAGGSAAAPGAVRFSHFAGETLAAPANASAELRSAIAAYAASAARGGASAASAGAPAETRPGAKTKKRRRGAEGGAPRVAKRTRLGAALGESSAQPQSGRAAQRDAVLLALRQHPFARCIVEGGVAMPAQTRNGSGEVAMPAFAAEAPGEGVAEAEAPME
jgi:hypothetical protein